MNARRVVGIVGRHPELGRLRAAAAAARTSGPVVVLVEGEAGMGKSRLVAEVSEDLRSQGWLVAVGHGVDLAGGAIPYGLAGSLVADLLQGLDESEAAQGAASLPALGLLWPDATTEPAAGRTGDRLGAIATVQRLLVTVASARPTCLVLEDVHWADSSSADLLTFLLKMLHDAEVLVLATTRPARSLPAPTRSHVVGLSRLPSAEVIELGPLSAEEATEQLTALLGRPPSPQAARELLELAEGVPLYVEELAADGMDPRRRVPGTLASMLRSRYDDLDDEAAAVLAAASVSTQPFDLAILTEVTERSPGSVARAVDEGLHQGLLDVASPGSYRFHHALLRRAIADAITGPSAEHWHRRWATAMERRDATATATVLAAEHWYQSGDAGRALAAAVAAGRVALEVDATHEAFLQWSRALELWPDAERSQPVAGLTRDDVLVHATEALMFNDDWEGLLRLLDADRSPYREMSPVRRLWEQLTSSYARSRLNPDQDFPEVAVGPALDLLETAAPSQLVRACLFWLWWDQFYADATVHHRILRLIDGIEQAAGGTGESAQVRLARRDVVEGHIDVGLGRMDQLLDSMTGRRDPPVRLAQSMRVWLLATAGLMREAADYGEEVMAQFSAVGRTSGLWVAIAEQTAYAHAMLGDWARAESLMTDPGTAPHSAPDLAQVRIAQGRLAEADALIRADRVEFGALPRRGVRLGQSSQHLVAKAALEAAEGEPLAARRRLRPVLVDDRLTADSEYLWTAVLLGGRFFDVQAVPGTPTADDREWTDVVEAAAARTHAFGVLGDAWRIDVEAHLARLNGRDDPELWQKAAEAWHLVGARYEEAWCRVRLAESLLRADEPDTVTAAAEALRSAAEAAEQLGAAPLAERVHRLARQARLGPPSARNRDVGSRLLTDREREVLVLLADGRTNQQIADTLFMSPKTASVHVSRIITKLGAQNRTEVVALAHRRGLLSEEQA